MDVAPLDRLSSRIASFLSGLFILFISYLCLNWLWTSWKLSESRDGDLLSAVKLFGRPVNPQYTSLSSTIQHEEYKIVD
jgi:hypothetical protein